MSVVDYTFKIKEIYDTLGSINMTVYEDEMLQACLRGLVQRFGPLWTMVCMREKLPNFFDLIYSMLMVEENYTGVSKSVHADNQMLHTETYRPHGRGGRGGSTHKNGCRYEQNQIDEQHIHSTNQTLR